jgi:Concanavalin A-like lectin/glucanases superfamily
MTTFTSTRKMPMKPATPLACRSIAFVSVGALLGLAVCGAQESREPTAKGSYQLEFSGQDSCVIIPKLRYDGSHPITLEALVTPTSRDDNPSRCCVLGNVELSGLAIHYRPFIWMFHFNEGRQDNAGYASAGSDNDAKLNQQVHVAGVYDGKNVRIFVDGKLQPHSDATTAPHKASIFDFMVGADPNAQGKPHQFFKGAIDEVRISKVARYQEDFRPAKEKFKPDASTLVLYHFDEGAGEVAKDASDNKYDGQIQNAKWVKVTD